MRWRSTPRNRAASSISTRTVPTASSTTCRATPLRTSTATSSPEASTAIALNQRSAAGSEGDAKADRARVAAFAQAAVRPMSAEQLFASLLTATGLEQVRNRRFKQAVRQRKQLALREFEFVIDDDEMAAGPDGFTAGVPQALLLLNGALSNQGVIAREGSSLARILDAHTDTDNRLRALWLTVYGRPPRSDELALGRDAVGDGDDVQHWEDLMFAMVYSAEFSSNH